MLRRIAALALGLVLVGAVPAGAVVGRSQLRVRKDVADMTPRERSDFVNAILKLKRTRSPYDPRLNYYDQFVEWHRELYRCTPGQTEMMAHGGPMFLPWHRDFVLAFENALRQVSGKPITVPYWDWTSQRSTVAALNLVGGDGNPSQDYVVTSGPFRKGRFRIRINPEQAELRSASTQWITRHVGGIGPLDPLPTVRDVATALIAPRYDASPWDNRADPARSFRVALEGYRDPATATGTAMSCGSDHLFHIFPIKGGLAYSWMHNAVHPWVGGLILHRSGPPTFGTMNLPTSPNDPIFFLHHANVDRLWAIWQKRHGIHTYQPVTALPSNGATSRMKPFDRVGLPDTPRGVEDITQLGYTYSNMQGPPPSMAGSAITAAVHVSAHLALLCHLAGW